MLGMVLLMILLPEAVGAFTRSEIDFGTIVGNCSRERPVFGKPIDGGDIGCYDRNGLVINLRPW